MQIESSKSVNIVPNTTACAKRVFKISENNPDGNKIAKGLASVFTPGIIAELTDEDKTLSKLKRARVANDYNAFKKVDPSFAQFYNISSVSEEGLLL